MKLAHKLKVRRNSAFTIIELLLVVSIIGILAGVTTTVINPTVQKNKALDSVRWSNIEKLAQAIESYCAAEGHCPPKDEVTNKMGAVPTYVKVWPTDATYTYLNNGATTAVESTEFEFNVVMASNSSKYIRYNSVWGKIQQCANNTVSAWATPTCT